MPMTMSYSNTRQSRGLGEPITIAAIVGGIAALLPVVMPLIQSWFQQNPAAPRPEDIAAPINSGQYQDAKAVEGYLSGKFGTFPANIRVGIVQMTWEKIANKTPEVGKGFRAAARTFPDLEPYVKQGAFGPETFMEKYGKVVIIGGAVVGVAVVGLVVYRIAKRSR